MTNKLFKLSVAGFIFVGIIGSLSHFIFEWSGYSRIIGALCPVNESPWEHLKLILLPYFIWTVIEYFMLKEDNKIFFCKWAGAVSGMAGIIIVFYTYSGIIGYSIGIINILSFFIGVFIAFATDYFMIKSNRFNKTFYNIIGIILFIILFAVFILFTFAPPLIPLFKDPLSLSYGI